MVTQHRREYKQYPVHKDQERSCKVCGIPVLQVVGNGGRYAEYCKDCRKIVRKASYDAKKSLQTACSKCQEPLDRKGIYCSSCLQPERSRHTIFMIAVKKLIEQQGNRCLICLDFIVGKKYAVDHDHTCCPSRKKSCGKCIRGVLCFKCNVGLGLFREDYDLLDRASRYLKGDQS